MMCLFDSEERAKVVVNGYESENNTSNYIIVVLLWCCLLQLLPVENKTIGMKCLMNVGGKNLN